MPFQVHEGPFLGMQPDPWELHKLTEMPPPKNKKRFASCSGIINCLSKYISATTGVSHLEDSHV